MSYWIPYRKESNGNHRHKHHHHIHCMHTDGIGTDDVASFAIAKPH